MTKSNVIIYRKLFADRTLSANERIIYSTLLNATFLELKSSHRDLIFNVEGELTFDNLEDGEPLPIALNIHNSILANTFNVTIKTIRNVLTSLSNKGYSVINEEGISVVLVREIYDSGYIPMFQHPSLSADQNIIYSYLIHLSSKYKVITTWSSAMSKVFGLSRPQLLKQIQIIAKVGLVKRDSVTQALTIM